MLFATDDELTALQRQAARLKRGETLSPEQARREALDDARELRAHARARQFAYLLFVVPAIAAILMVLMQFVVTLLFGE